MPDLLFADSLLAQADKMAAPEPGVIAALIVFIAASVWLGTMAQKVVRRSSFVKGFFLGNRGLGAWALALTATVQSGGTFMGFPSLVYSYGWVVALWIGSYMVVPITGFALVGKRVAQISRRTGAITMPDLFRERFGSPTLGMVTSLLIILFLSSQMLAQFKAGGTLMKLAFPGTSLAAFADADGGTAAAKVAAATKAAEPETGFAAIMAKLDGPYLAGLIIFALTVVGYTLIGGFLAAVWTDLFQSVMMFIGVLVLLFLSLRAVGGLEAATLDAAKGAQIAAENAAKRAAEEGKSPRDVAPNEGNKFLFAPGFSPDGRAYLPLTLAVSFFLFWPATGFASPASVTRVMACKDSRTLRHSVFLLCVYNLGIYLPLICICICARALMPDLQKPDEVIPRMALTMTEGVPLGQLISGMILAAPFGAIMATVSTYLVVIASGLVRDLYQRFVNPEASEQTIRRLTRWGMVLVGVFAVLMNIYPVRYLQALVVFGSAGGGASFIVPCLMLCYWRRATAAGAMAAMLGGSGTILSLYILGAFLPDPMMGPQTAFRPYFLLGMEPLIWSVAMSAVAGITVSLATDPPDEAHVSKLFDRQPEAYEVPKASEPATAS